MIGVISLVVRISDLTIQYSIGRLPRFPALHEKPSYNLESFQNISGSSDVRHQLAFSKFIRCECFYDNSGIAADMQCQGMLLLCYSGALKWSIPPTWE
jgi:hypothetical protein